MQAGLAHANRGSHAQLLTLEAPQLLEPYARPSVFGARQVPAEGRGVWRRDLNGAHTYYPPPTPERSATDSTMGINLDQLSAAYGAKLGAKAVDRGVLPASYPTAPLTPRVASSTHASPRKRAVRYRPGEKPSSLTPRAPVSAGAAGGGAGSRHPGVGGGVDATEARPVGCGPAPLSTHRPARTAQLAHCDDTSSAPPDPTLTSRAPQYSSYSRSVPGNLPSSAGSRSRLRYSTRHASCLPASPTRR